MPEDEGEGEEGGVDWTDLALILFVGGMLLLNVTGLFPRIFGLDTALVVTLAGGYGIFCDSLSRLFKGKVGGDLAVTIAAFAALAIGQYVAAAEVVLIMLIGTALESYAVGKTRGAIASLVKLSPTAATVVRDGRELSLPVAEIRTGDRVLIRPGERVPVDGSVVRGQSAVDQAALTGEPVPVPKALGDPVYAGTMNALGLLEVEVEAAGEETALARIIQLVEEAERRKAPVERLADRWAGYFVPAVVTLGALTFLFWWALLRAPLDVALTRMASALIIACPCALILATPTAIAAGIGRCARRGILLRGGLHLETLARVDCVVFDKTGTLTTGRPEVTEVVPLDGRGRGELLRLAAAAEQGSAHPLAAAVLDAHRDGPLPSLETAEFRPGLGMVAVLNGGGPAHPRVLVGNRQLLAGEGVELTEEAEEAARGQEARGRTALFIAAEGRALGVIAAEDRLRPEAAAVVSGLKALGISRVLMLTGDAPQAAERVARDAGIEEWEAGLFPAEKTARIRALQEQGWRVAMVGDGINDAPSLAAANVGVAIGRGAADIAVEAADVVLVADDLARLPEAVLTGREVLRTVHRSIWWFAIGLNGFSVVAGASGLLAFLGYRLQEWWPAVFGYAGRDLSPVLAAVEHQIASLLVVTSSLRLLRGRRAWQPGDRKPGLLPPRPAPAAGPPRLVRWLVATAAVRFASAALQSAAQYAHKYPMRLARAAGVALILGWLLSGLYQVPMSSAGVVQRFGRFLSPEAGPGLRYHLPWPIDGVTLVDVRSVRRAEIGFRSSQQRAASWPFLPPGPASAARELAPSEWSTQHAGRLQRVGEESLMLTGDEYLLDATLTLQYRIEDPGRYLFRSRDAEGLLRESAEAAVRRAAGKTPLEALLTTGRAAIEAEVLQSAQAACDRFDTGLRVLEARLQEVHPPQEVVTAYRDVSSAEEEKGTAINQAEAYRNEAVPLARGEAAQNVARAAGYTVDRTRRSSGDAARFTRAVEGYRAGPEVNRERLYLETAEQALAAPRKFVMDGAAGGRRQMWLTDGQLFGLPGLPAPAEPAPQPAPPVEEGQ